MLKVLKGFNIITGLLICYYSITDSYINGHNIDLIKINQK